MDTRSSPPRLLAFLEAASSTRVKAERRLQRAYRRSGSPQPTDPRALALAVALVDADDATFISEIVAAEAAGWPELPAPSFVRLRLAWDATYAGDYGSRDVKGWGPEHREMASQAVRQRSRTTLGAVLNALWHVDREVARREPGIAIVCKDAPELLFGDAPEHRLSPIRKGEPYFMSDDGFAVGAYHAWYAADKEHVGEYASELRAWLRSQWPEALDVLIEDEPFGGMPFGSWTMRRVAEAFVRTLTFEEATYMIMEDQRLEDSPWM